MRLGAWMVAIPSLIRALQTPYFRQTVKTKKPFTSCFFLTSISKRVLAYKHTFMETSLNWKMNEQEKLISIWQAVHQDSFWNKGNSNSQMPHSCDTGSGHLSYVDLIIWNSSHESPVYLSITLKIQTVITGTPVEKTCSPEWLCHAMTNAFLILKSTLVIMSSNSRARRVETAVEAALYGLLPLSLVAIILKV